MFTMKNAMLQRQVGPVGVSLADYGGNWVNAMAAAHSAGDLITVPAGTWSSPQVVPYAGLTIRGVGATSIVARNAAVSIDGAAIPTTSPLFKIHNTTNVTITDLKIRGWPIGSGGSDDIGISGVEATGLTLQRLFIENMQGMGIQTQGAAGNMTGALLEDITITNTLYRSNGAHGVALWLYKGTANSTIRRITTNGSAEGGVFFDAGTTGDVNARSVDNNVLVDISINNASGLNGAVLFSGADNNSITNLTITNFTSGASGPIIFGIDQSGIGDTGNVITNVTLSNITSGRCCALDPDTDTCGNTLDTVNGTWLLNDPNVCTTLINSPGVTRA